VTFYDAEVIIRIITKKKNRTVMLLYRAALPSRRNAERILWSVMRRMVGNSRF